VDKLKRDRSLVHSDDLDGRMYMPAAVLGLAAAADLSIVAEGVESAEQVRRWATGRRRVSTSLARCRRAPSLRWVSRKTPNCCAWICVEKREGTSGTSGKRRLPAQNGNPVAGDGNAAALSADQSGGAGCRQVADVAGTPGPVQRFCPQ
jgi:hypothetical protein